MVFEILRKRDCVALGFEIVLGLVDRLEEGLESFGNGFKSGLWSGAVVAVELLDSR
jgi:hypothetical protein